MAWSCEQVNCEELKPAKNAEEFALHLAAVEWSLAESIVISNRDDIKSRAKWKDGFDPYHHQVQNLMTFCRRLPVTLLADDVGLGKTISAGLILGELMERKRVTRALVVCPAILGPQWVEELSAKFGIDAVFTKGKELSDFLEKSDVPVVVTTYASARTRLGAVRSGQFDMLILDEAHKLRNLRGTDKPPLMAQRVREALESRIFKFVLMLTATPIQNRVWDLYSLIDLLTVAKGHRNPLGNPGEFRVRFVDDAAGRRLRPRTASEFRSILRQYIVRTRREEAMLKFPDRLVETRKLRGTEVEARMAQIVKAEIDDLSPLVQISLSQAMMSSPQALALQLEHMSAKGGISEIVTSELRRFASTDPMTAKLEGLLTLVRELRKERPDDWRLVVFTLRKETQDAIGRALQKEGIAVSFIRGGASNANQATVEKFRAVPPQCNVIVSTDAGAEGVNLQSGNVLVNYDLPWNPMVMEQRIGRIQRLASKHESVVIVNLVIADSVEERVVGRLLEKLQAVAETIGDIETILESAGQDDDDSFEEMVRKLVVSSLRGQDVEASTRAATTSIERARVLMKEERGNIDRVFGNEPPPLETGPTPPEFQPVTPSIASEEFARRILTAEGATLQPLSNGTHALLRKGKIVERLAFQSTREDETDETSPGKEFGIQKYLPGRPPFERLVQRWLEKGGHLIHDITAGIEMQNFRAAKAWCATVPGALFQTTAVRETFPYVAGTAICRARAANGMDSLEKIFYIDMKHEGHDSLETVSVTDKPVETEPVLPNVFFQGLEENITEAVESDSDMKRFCKFYESRKFDELSRAGADDRRRHKVISDLTPKVYADVVALRGIRYNTARSVVTFMLDEEHRYEVEIEILPVTGKILSEPERAECAITGNLLPVPCLSKCSVTGRLATTHLMARNAAGEFTLPETISADVARD